ncbi:hypothetical protein RAD15_43385, partial [Bradyrhizobium sp. 14AA]
AQINRRSDKLRHGRLPSLWRSGDHVLALDAVQVGPSTTSLRAKRSNPEPFRRGILDCFAALAMTDCGHGPVLQMTMSFPATRLRQGFAEVKV